MDIAWIQDRVRMNEYIYSIHAEIERKNDHLTTSTIEEACLNGEIIEQYPNDPRGKSCLILGYSAGVPIHIVCGEATSGWLIIITVYIPKEPKWLTPKQRRNGK